MVVSKFISIPQTLYLHFVINERHKMNKMTLSTFVGDEVKSTLLTIIIGAPVLAIFIKIMEWGGELFYIYMFIFVVIFVFIMMWIVPNFIMPLFNKYEELPQGELKSAIEKLASDQKFPLKKLYSMDGSKRSAHSNAFLFGFGGNKRIVLFDTLIN